jgi:HD-GYP domain-containing protein (c-di-GMP phosphodiesterase class II)
VTREHSGVTTILEQTTLTHALVGAARRYQVRGEDLRLGMFVVELDRPWLDTPFLLQGFLIDSQVELDTLVRYCEYAYVDIGRSTEEAAAIVRRVEIRNGAEPAVDAVTEPLRVSPATVPRVSSSVATRWARPGESAADDAQINARKLEADKRIEEREAARRQARDATAGTVGSDRPIAAHAAASSRGAGAKKVIRSRADIKISQQTRERFRAMVKQNAVARAENDEGLIGRLFGRLINSLSKEKTFERSKLDPAELLPQGMEAVQHREKTTLEEELPRARQAFSQGETVLNTVMSDMRGGKLPQLAEIGEAVDGMVGSMLDNPDALMWVARLREEDLMTYNHGLKVALYLVALGRHLGFPRRELGYLGQIGMLADIGKTRVARSILEKPGMLTPDEFTAVKEHVKLGLQVFASGPKLPEPVMLGIAQHHERMNGSGYPKGLEGSKISVYGRMAAIADSFAALITPRAYANASAPQDALMNLYEWSGTSFHEPMVEAFVQAVGVFPVGSLVELSTAEIAVVVAHNRIRRLEPKVLILSTPEKTPLPQPVERDLHQESRRKGDAKPLRITRGMQAGAFGFKLRDYYLDEKVARQNGIL